MVLAQANTNFFRAGLRRGYFSEHEGRRWAVFRADDCFHGSWFRCGAN